MAKPDSLLALSTQVRLTDGGVVPSTEAVATRFVGAAGIVAAVAVPLSPTARPGLTGSLLATVSEALSAPATVGVKVTTMAQFAPAARLAGQLFDCWKEVALAPPMPMLPISSGEVPVLDRATACAVLE